MTSETGSNKKEEQVKELKDGRIVAPSTLLSAQNIKRMYSMDLDTLLGCIFDFDIALENAHIRLEGSNYHKYRRGYLLKCDEVWSNENYKLIIGNNEIT